MNHKQARRWYEALSQNQKTDVDIRLKGMGRTSDRRSSLILLATNLTHTCVGCGCLITKKQFASSGLCESICEKRLLMDGRFPISGGVSIQVQDGEKSREVPHR